MIANDSIYISECIRAVPNDFVRLEGTITLLFTPWNFSQNGYIFHLKTVDFIFSGGIFNSTITLQRDDQVLKLPVKHVFKNHELISVFFDWTPEVLRTSYAIIPCLKNTVDKEVELKTYYTTPPNSLVNCLRKKNLIETTRYDNENALRDRVYSVLNSLEARILEMHSVNAFWNITYEGNKIIAKLPKRETDIHPVIQAILSDQMFMSSIEVVPEYTTGVGRLDFMLMASIKKGGVGKICIEVKNAHSEELINGLVK